jgi:hypothetical protein
MFARPPREIYIRVSRPRNQGGHVDVGLEWRPTDEERDIRYLVREWLREEDDAHPSDCGVSAAHRIERRIRETWPDRAYFIESWLGSEDDGWIQIFQPFGIPRNESSNVRASDP